MNQENGLEESPGTPPRTIEILYHDEHMVAVNKPSGLVVHRSKAARDAENCLGIVRDAIGRWVYPAHRLDRGTSGVLLFATDPGTARLLGEAFMNRSVRKEYLVVVRGWVPERGEIDHPINLDGDLDIVDARTEYVSLAQTELPYAVSRYPTSRYSLVRAHPFTGRTHQIRRHMAHIDHPVIGDTTYGKGPHNRLFREVLGIHRMLLHAARLSLPHPHTGEPLDIIAPLPEDLQELFVRLGWGSGLPFTAAV
ncbi:MAG: hypothetical protein JST22_03290 [Bacteroidetes bacterium]|nr:hypothetical protein [Bacteroidota bacterium]